MIETLGQAQRDIKDGLDPRLQLELALVKITRPQVDASAAAFEERVSHSLLQALDLGGQGGLGQMKALGGARQVAVMGNSVEIAEMMIVKLAHNVLFYRTISQKQ